ncbi:flagellar protein [Mesobaculum littorinae]|uniref:Flagellin n=1 Tax=Mesobaculum littorinae TaxID=2486419 RepID=A0A438ADY3_9RHOB|nr:flagellin [Mesobaculum littorinae]RVV96868.1 flagellar protein [Mesobaculum littorinae]
MSSILTNNSATAALSTLRNINSNLESTQGRISTGLKITSGKDNAAYFSISETMNAESNMYKAIDESLTLRQNAVATARLGAETVSDIAEKMVERVAFAQGSLGDSAALADIQGELTELASQMETTIDQATFNGRSLVKGTATETVVTGINRTGATLDTTTFTFDQQDLGAIHTAMSALDVTAPADADAMKAVLVAAETQLQTALGSATALGIAEKSIETQKGFLSELTNRIDAGVGSMVDADMEEEAARLQSLQVQQQLATQSLSIANQAPQAILSLFR